MTGALGDRRQPVGLAAGDLRHPRRISARLGDDGPSDAGLVVQQGGQQVQRRQLRVRLGGGHRLRGGEGLLCKRRDPIHSHDSTSGAAR